MFLLIAPIVQAVMLNIELLNVILRLRTLSHPYYLFTIVNSIEWQWQAKLQAVMLIHDRTEGAGKASMLKSVFIFKLII